MGEREGAENNTVLSLRSTARLPWSIYSVTIANPGALITAPEECECECE